MYAGCGGYPTNSTAILVLLVRARKDKKADVSKKLYVLPNIDGLYLKIDTVVHLKQSGIAENWSLEHESISLLLN